ncbi:MAG: type II toxin-antitoxin system VapC family toxin [Anaerolineae bacterium]|nr:type II toxin-antitoxin system VapC family toxin [Anaerolineae bacterium]
MSVYFVDTSALAKRYVPEIGSQWVISWILPEANHVVIISELASVEFFSLLNRRVREGTLTASSLAILQSNFLVHQEKDYLVVQLDNTVAIGALMLVNKYPLRTLDALQLSSALKAKALFDVPMTFVSADRNLLQAASAEGFVTDNPNDHP